LPCSRTRCTLRASNWLRPCWTDFFEHSRQLLISVLPRACMCDLREIFNTPKRHLCDTQPGRIDLRGLLNTSQFSERQSHLTNAMNHHKLGACSKRPLFHRIIPNIWFLPLSSGSLNYSSPMVRRLPSGPKEGRSHQSAGLV
jgi:hypothetical protein